MAEEGGLLVPSLEKSSIETSTNIQQVFTSSFCFIFDIPIFSFSTVYSFIKNYTRHTFYIKHVKQDTYKSPSGNWNVSKLHLLKSVS